MEAGSMNKGWTTICAATAVALLSVTRSTGGDPVAKGQAGAALAADNPIVIENRRAGTAGVLTTLLARYNQTIIAGYADATSVDRGRRIALRVSTSQPGAYTINVYRMGFYGG